MAQKRLVIGNWKMNLTASGCKALVEQCRGYAEELHRSELWIAPSYLSLAPAKEAAQHSPLKVGAQNVHWKEDGAFTGEVSIPMLRDVGVDFIIVGHSERRTLYGDTNETVGKRAHAVLEATIPCVLCIGEGIDARLAGSTHHVLREQLRSALLEEIDHNRGKLQKEHFENLIIAYEPVWAIGTGRSATVEQAEIVHRSIRLFVETGWNRDIASAMRILYGGSVTPQNIASILACDAIDGALVGGACLNLDSFATILSFAQVPRA